MGERCTIVLYGNSLLVAGLEASLKDQPDLDVVRIDATLPDTAQRLDALCPDVVIFDLNTPTSHPPAAFRTDLQSFGYAQDGPPAFNLQSPISILQEHPGISLIGLGPNSSKVLVLSGQQHTVLAISDLAQVIQSLTRT